MRRRSHRACHYYVERRRTAGPTTRQACCASPRLAWLFSSLSPLSLSRARPLALLTDTLAVLLILSLSSLSLSPLSLSLSLWRRQHTVARNVDPCTKPSRVVCPPHTWGGSSWPPLRSLEPRLTKVKKLVERHVVLHLKPARKGVHTQMLKQLLARCERRGRGLPYRRHRRCRQVSLPRAEVRH